MQLRAHAWQCLTTHSSGRLRRRLIPALGAVVEHIPTFYICFGSVILLATSVARYIYLTRLIKRLKQIDMPQWVCMGSPEATFFSRFRNYTTWRPPGLEVPVTQYSELSLWLDQGEDKSLHDVEITEYASRYRLLGILQFLLCVIAICTLIFFQFVAHRVAP
jgi:hypothetical protein